MDEIIKQAPEGIDFSLIKEIYEKNNQDVIKTLMELWDIKEKEEKDVSKTQKHWNDIRETCDAFDIEMAKVMKEAKKILLNYKRMDRHSYNSLYRTIKEQYSRPAKLDNNYDFKYNPNGINMEQGSLLQMLTEGELGKSLANLYNIPTMNNLFESANVASSSLMSDTSKTEIKDDRNSYIYIYSRDK